MRPTRATVLLTAGLVTLLGTPAVAAAETPASLYVNNAANSNCSDTGTGSQAVPYCTISAAADAVQPGQTVRIKPWTYDENVTINRSGEPGKPITFTSDTDSAQASLERDKSLRIIGASHVEVRGLRVYGGVQVSRSADVELDGVHIGPAAEAGLVVGGGSKGVRVVRSSLIGGVRIDGGARDTVLGRNTIGREHGPALEVVDAPGTVVTNNTFDNACGTTVSVGGTSTGSALFNNVLFTKATGIRCEPVYPLTNIEVSASAAAGTRADYNLITGPEPKRLPYKWGGIAYQTPAAFTAATGQGAHDILAADSNAVGPKDGSPTTDSGDPTAPGVLPVDYYGKPTADDPRVANTGKGGGYIDRGAYETQDELSGVQITADPAWAPVGTKVKLTATTSSAWGDPLPLTYRFDFADGTDPVVTDKNTVEHVFTKAYDYGVNVTVTDGAGREVFDRGSHNASPEKKLQAWFMAPSVSPDSTSPDKIIRPLTYAIDSTYTQAPWPLTSVDVDFGDGTTVHDTGLGQYEHVYKVPGTYKVTLTVQDIKGATSTTTKDVTVRYGSSNFAATEPFRLLDTRTTQAPVRGGVATPVVMPAGRAVPGHILSGGMSSAVLNVTVTDATEDTHLTVWPSGQPRPATSNLNIRAGSTSANMVTVPLGSDGKVQAQLNSGKASLIVDFVGYYQPGEGSKFSSIAPSRLADTRTSGGALGGGKTRTVKVAGVKGIPSSAKAVALNLTGTGATAPAHVIAYPNPSRRPTTSNLNVEPGKDKSNQTIVPVGPDGTITLYTNTGSTHLVVDAVGFYGKDGKYSFSPVVPERLADSRVTGKVAPGATMTVPNLPYRATSAVLNVTATDTTGPGFLTVYEFGAARPGASSLNTLPGFTVPNHVTTPVHELTKRVSIFNSHGGSNHVIVDVLGYFW